MPGGPSRSLAAFCNHVSKQTPAGSQGETVQQLWWQVGSHAASSKWQSHAFTSMQLDYPAWLTDKAVTVRQHLLHQANDNVTMQEVVGSQTGLALA